MRVGGSQRERSASAEDTFTQAAALTSTRKELDTRTRT